VPIILSVCPAIAQGNDYPKSVDLRIRRKGMNSLLVSLIKHFVKEPLLTILNRSLYLPQ
jgi:hypothetical protein